MLAVGQSTFFWRKTITVAVQKKLPLRDIDTKTSLRVVPGSEANTCRDNA